MKQKQVKKLIFFVIALVILIAVAVVSGVFEDFADFKTGIKLISFNTVISLFIMVAAMLIITNVIILILNVIKPKSGRAKTILSICSSLIHYISFLIIAIWGLSILGVNINTIFASVGVFALIIGFGAESLIADVMTGAFMLFENQYNVGDIIEISGFRGTVVNIGIRTTRIKDVGDNIKIINNSNMHNIVNKSNEKSFAVCDVPVSYNDNLEQIEQQLDKLLDKLVEEHNDIFNFKPKYVGVQSLADSSVILRVVANVEERNIYTAARVMNRDIYIGLGKAGYYVPFPQLDVHSIT